MLDGKIGALTTTRQAVYTNDHQPVIMTGLAAEGPGVWPAGLILTRNENLELIPWEGETVDDSGGEPVDTTAAPAGVLIDECDLTKQVSANYLAHGTAAWAALTKADGSRPTAAELIRLALAGIFGV